MATLYDVNSIEQYQLFARPRNGQWWKDVEFYDLRYWTYLDDYHSRELAEEAAQEHFDARIGVNYSYIIVKKVISYFADTPLHKGDYRD